MCGRYWFKSDKKVIVNEFNVYEVMTEVRPNYNVAPSQNVLCVTRNGHNRLVSMRWGLVPSWAKDAQIGFKMINARAETLVQKPSFLKPLQSQRCLIIADGFYEWRKTAPVKTPLAFQLKSHKPFGFAGLYDRWQSPDDETITSCSIITTDANDLIAPIHNRMPVILPADTYEIWLDSKITSPSKLLPLLKPFDSSVMESYEVSTQVNSVKYNNPDAIKPVR